LFNNIQEKNKNYLKKKTCQVFKSNGGARNLIRLRMSKQKKRKDAGKKNYTPETQRAHPTGSGGHQAEVTSIECIEREELGPKLDVKKSQMVVWSERGNILGCLKLQFLSNWVMVSRNRVRGDDR